MKSRSNRSLSNLIAFGLAALSAAGCAGDPAAQQATAQTPSTAASLPATAADAQDLTSEIDKIFNWTTPATPGCAAAASQHGKLVVNRAYGSADLERDVPISANSVFDIGSTHKQFVAASVLLLVEQGRLSLSDDIRKHIPELPDYGHKVTVDHLLTHTGGVRDWTALLPMSAADDDALSAILRQRGLNFAPGEEFSYSNSGYVLAKEIVARVSGMSFADFARQRIFEPLGMKESLYDDDMLDIVKNRALAYQKEGDTWKLSMRLDKDRGGGGVLSTTGDLLIWNDALTNRRLGAFVTEKLQEPAKLNNGRRLDYGRGLFIETEDGEPRMYQHSGGSAGYQAMLVRVLKPGVSIAVLCNSGDGTDQGLFARGILDLLAPEYAGRRPESVAAVAIPAESLDLNGRSGLFLSEGGGEPLRLIANDGRLRVANGPPLVPVAADRFRNPRGQTMFMSQDEFELRFLSRDAFELKSMEGKITRYRRTEPYAPAAAELQAFAGRYRSDELGAVFEISSRQAGLGLRLEHLPERVLHFGPIYRDTFQFSQMTVRFHRDAAGKVVALDYSNPVVRNIRLTRLDER